MRKVEGILLLFTQFLIYYVSFIFLTLNSMKVVGAIPLINRTNPYYERHLEHINSA